MIFERTLPPLHKNLLNDFKRKKYLKTKRKNNRFPEGSKHKGFRFISLNVERRVDLDKKELALVQRN